ncbi:MAG TPA: hypothetical protein VGD78_07255 [Chthoniobacterales bacterium]
MATLSLCLAEARAILAGLEQTIVELSSGQVRIKGQFPSFRYILFVLFILKTVGMELLSSVNAHRRIAAVRCRLRLACARRFAVFKKRLHAAMTSSFHSAKLSFLRFGFVILPLWVPGLLIAAPKPALPAYVLQDLSALDATYPFHEGYAINEWGDAVGVASGVGLAPHAFLYRRRQLIDLGAKLNSPDSGATSINALGEVVGYFIGNLTLGTTAPTLGFLYAGCRPQTVKVGSIGNDAIAINNLGEIVGIFNDASGHGHGYLRKQDGKIVELTALASLGATDVDPVAINDWGQVAGWYYGPKSGAFLTQPGGAAPKDLGTLGGLYSTAALGVNDLGQVVGYSAVGDNAQHGFLYAGGAMHDLGTLGGPNSWAYGINNWGEIVGWSDPAGGGETRAWVYLRGQMRDLNDLLSPASKAWTVFEGRSINDRGRILANATNDNFTTVHAVILTPECKRER